MRLPGHCNFPSLTLLRRGGRLSVLFNGLYKRGRCEWELCFCRPNYHKNLNLCGLSGEWWGGLWELCSFTCTAAPKITRLAAHQKARAALTKHGQPNHSCEWQPAQPVNQLTLQSGWITNQLFKNKFTKLHPCMVKIKLYYFCKDLPIKIST